MLVTTAMAVVLSASAALATDALVAPGPSDDAYHYRYFADGKHDGNYLEWWYFNFLDAANDVQAIFSYAIVDPENLTGSGMAFMGVIAYTPEGVVADADSCPVEQFHASYYDANVEICGSDIVVLDRDTYRIQGSIASGLVSWDLTYSSRAEPWFSGDREWVGLFPWERMSWLVYMPGAEVSGTIEIEGRSYTVDAQPGYHDHNWGEWIPCNTMWNWFQYFEPGLSLEVGDFILHPAGTLSVDFEGERVVFSKLQYCVLHTRWKMDWANLKLVPKKTWLYADNGERRLVTEVRTRETEPLVLDLPVDLAPNVIIYEQTARYEGSWWGRNAQDEWDLLRSFEGEGFKEYTVRKWLE